MKKRRSPTIHILLHGFALCRFSEKLPGDWPYGHRWVGGEEAHLATCPDCKRWQDTLKYRHNVG